MNVNKDCIQICNKPHSVAYNYLENRIVLTAKNSYSYKTDSMVSK